MYFLVKVRKNLVGERFGKLIVLEQVEDHVSSNNKRISQWLCQCDCGNTVVVSSISLKNGHTKSCGCIKLLREDLTGQRFGKLTVLSQSEDYIYPSGNHMSRWLCECDCGNTVVVNSNSLKSGSTQSCGCIKKENLVGKQFGRLTVVEEVEAPESRKNKGIRYWLCKCNCESNKTVIVSTSDLKSGHTTSCGCYAKEQAAIKIVEQNKKSAGHGKKNKVTKFYKENGYAYGYTSNTNKKFYIDIDDIPFAEKYTWYENDQGYIMSRIDGKLVRLHRQLIDCQDGLDVDHIKHNKQDNRKNELREVTRSQNNMNKNANGVTKLKNGKYRAYIGVNYKTIYLGTFENFDDALNARKQAEEKYFGEYSYDNSMNNDYTEVII